MADDDDDYMSDAVLAKCGQGVAGSSSSGLCWDPKVQRKRKLEEKVVHTNAKNRTKPARAIEQEHRDAGLKAVLDEKNKGFALLQKMGYKPGTAIGKAGVGLVEPISVELKLSRTGLGTEAEAKRKQDEARARLQSFAARRTHLEASLKADFVGSMSARFNVKAVERDLHQSQKVCEQLDAAKGIEQPVRSFFWFHLPKPQEPAADDGDPDATDDQHAAAKQAEAESSEDACLDVSERLAVLTQYLREEHLYCVWCGTTFNDPADMVQSCPGDTAEMHDNA